MSKENTIFKTVNVITLSYLLPTLRTYFAIIIVMINLVILVKGHETTENQESRSAKVT